MAKTWTRPELLIALGLYCQLPFGQFHSKNKLVRQTAEAMNRTPGSVAMKLSNLASLDPVITANGRKGLRGASVLDKAIWNEFTNHTDKLVPAVEEALQSLLTPQSSSTKQSDDRSYIEEDHYANVKVRKGQKLFRDAVLSAYDHRCCVTGISDPRFLIASHIRPWKTDAENRLNPRNGLCLSLMFDKAFDLGLITLSENFHLMISSELQSLKDNQYMTESFISWTGKPIELPSKFSPNKEFLAWHRTSVFLGSPL